MDNSLSSGTGNQCTATRNTCQSSQQRKLQLFFLAVLTISTCSVIRLSLVGVTQDSPISDHEIKLVLFNQNHSPVLPNQVRHDEPLVITMKRRPLIPGNTPAFYAERGASSSDVAVVTLMGGINPSNNRYLGFFYNTLVMAQRLKDDHSIADLVLFLQISPSTNATTLPANQISALEAKHIRIYYVPKPLEESYYDTMLDKFRMLDLIQYKRLLYLDGDVMPLTNLDFFLRYHQRSSIFRPNVILTTPLEPAQGGSFVLTPGVGEWDLLVDVVRDRTKGRNSTEFDVVRGWGHEFTDDDPVITRKGKLKDWSFFAAGCDQGLLYYWTKYIKRNVSIIFNDQLVHNWEWDVTKNRVVLQESIHHPFQNESSLSTFPLPNLFGCDYFLCYFSHFTTEQKPWYGYPSNPMSYEDATTGVTNAKHFWWYTLRQVDHELQLNIDFDHWNPEVYKSPLGLWPNPLPPY